VRSCGDRIQGFTLLYNQLKKSKNVGESLAKLKIPYLMELQKCNFTIIRSFLVCIHKKLLGTLILILLALLAYMHLMFLAVYKIRYFICTAWMAYCSHRGPLCGHVATVLHTWVPAWPELALSL